MSVELYEHQQIAVDKMHNGCILRGDVGTGKTITSLFYFVLKVCLGVVGVAGSMKTPKRLIVITTAKKRDSMDWEKDAAMLGIFKDGADHPQGVSITVDSWNNIAKYVGVTDAFFIFDEQRLVGAGAWTKMFIDIAKHNEWILLSATPGDTWLDYIPVFVANGFYKNRTEFKREHVVYNNYSKFPKVERYTSPGILVRHRNAILVEMPYKRHTVRHEIEVEVDFDQELFKRVLEDRWHVYEERPLRDVAELFSVMRKVVNSDPSRLRAIQKLMEEHPRLIVFYNFNYELEMLRTLVDSVSEENTGTELGTRSSSPTSQPSSTSGSLPTKMSSSASLEMPKGISSETGMIDHSAWTKQRKLSSGAKQLSPHSTSSGSYISESLVWEECPGHWTEDEGYGEIYLDCKDGVCWVPDGGVTEAGELTGAWEVCGDTWKCSGGCLDGFASVRKQTPKPEPVDFTLAEWNGHKHEQVPDTDKWLYLVQYVAGAEGWNCVSTDAVAFWSLTYSYKNFHQSKGRIDRLNTPFIDLYYYMLKSKSLIDKAVAKSLVEKKSFNETDFGKKLLAKKAMESDDFDAAVAAFAGEVA